MDTNKSNKNQNQNQNQKQGGINDFNQKIERKALIIADTFTSLFSPINKDTSEALIPICNIPIIEYMFDFLFSNSITEIIICSAKNSDSLKSYLKKNHNKNNQIKLITSDEFQDIGDCLRKVNSEKLITSDFVLIRGLVIANFDLEDAFNFHVEKKKADPYVILTSIMKEYKNDKYIKTKYDESFLIVNKQTKQILQYESIQCGNDFTVNDNVKLTLSKPKNEFDIPIANQYQVKSLLIDTFIDICAPDVLNHFSENFDYHSIRDDLIKNIIVNEIFSDKFMLYELRPDQYSAVARNFESYLKINSEIVNRWAHPIVIENMNLPEKLKIAFKVNVGNTYFDGSNIKMGKNSKYNNSNVFGSDSKIGENTEIFNSVLGKNVIIGKNSYLKNCVILQGAEISDNCNIENSIIGKNTFIEENLKIKNCYISDELTLKFPGEKNKELNNLRINLALKSNNISEISGEDDDDVDNNDLYFDNDNDNHNEKEEINNENDKDNNNNINSKKDESDSKEKIPKLEMTDNNEFLMQLNDKDYMLSAIDQRKEKEKKGNSSYNNDNNDNENYNENDNDNDNENTFDDYDEFTESEEEEELDEDYDEEMKGIVQAGIEDSDKISDVVQEIMALKFSFKYKTFSDSNLKQFNF
jgi:translation initiation factor eIF-2B subunit epsilon